MNVFRKWLQENLFTHDFFDNKFFSHEIELYSHQPLSTLQKHLQLREEKFTHENLYRPVMKACGVHKLKRDGLWFHVNVVDQCVWILEDYKRYPFPLPHSEKPLGTLFWRMEKYPAEQAGTTYVGLLSDDRKWLLLIEHGAESIETLHHESDFKIRFCSTEALCKTVCSFLKTKAA